MKSRIFYSIFSLLLIFHIPSQAQTYSNSWIDFNNEYFKFKVWEEGVYKITQSKLNEIGLGNVPGSNFAVFREGKEIPLRVTTPGILGPTDYIEFYATKADGKIDTELYPNPSFQPNIELNLISDTAYYFLTHSSGNHLRFTEVNNPIPTPLPTPAPYCWSTINMKPSYNNRARFADGKSYSFSEPFYSSEFDLGEGYKFNSPNTLSFNFYNIVKDQGVDGSLSFVSSSQSISSGNRGLTISINNNQLFDTVYTDRMAIIKKTVQVPNNSFTNSGGSLTFNVSHLNYSSAMTGFYFVSYRYPRNYKFNNDFVNKAPFEIPVNEQFLDITSYSLADSVPSLYDLTNNIIYSGTYTSNRLRYFLNSSSTTRSAFIQRRLTIQNIENITAVTFADYHAAQNQGDYIILTHPEYINASPNYINDYKNYRASFNGGQHNPVVIDVTELYDQFGYGYDYHALAIKKFLKFASEQWSVQPKYLFIIGKGVVYNKYTDYLDQRNIYTYPVVPTWGNPGSDNLLSDFNNSNIPTLATARLSAWNNEEIGTYLEKVQSYEIAQKFSAIPNVADDYWKKQGLHIAGASNSGLQITLLSSLNAVKQIYEDTLIGGSIYTVAKSTTDPVDQENNLIVDSFMNSGVNLVSFYGHASASGFDFNLNNPENYNNKPHFPMFYAFGCDVAHIFTLTNNKTISERYIENPNGGSISMIAGDNLGYTGTLPTYKKALYQSFSYKDYGNTLGMQYRNTLDYLINNYPTDMMKIHVQCMLLQGDPALKTFNPLKPDYVVENLGLSTIPANISSALDSFQLKAIVYNLGKAINDSVWVKVEHTKTGDNTVLYADSILLSQLYNSDTIIFTLPIQAGQDVGMNNYTVSIDPSNQFDEISKQNNKAKIQVYIYSNNVELIYPYNFGIVNKPDVTLKASILNAFAPHRSYKFEIDTTELFNSPILKSSIIHQAGGVIKWKPVLNYQDSTVYYWRVAVDSVMENGDLNWKSSSFIYLANGSEGWNQSHFYQYQKNEFKNIISTEANRDFTYNSYTNKLVIMNKVIFTDFYNVNHSLNDVILSNNSCGTNGAIQVIVLDSMSGVPWQNSLSGDFNSLPTCLGNTPPPRYEFKTTDINSRNDAKNFLESIPNNNYVGINNFISGGLGAAALWDRQTINEWMADTLVNGSGISLYHTIKNMGFDLIDSFTSKKSFAFFRKKGNNNYPIYQEITPDSTSAITLTAYFESYSDTGIMKSTVIGPVLSWDTLQWDFKATDGYINNDMPFVKIFGINAQGEETQLYSGNDQNLPLNFINASTYPKIRMNWYAVDTITRTSPQLSYWRVLYQPLPEAALNPIAYFSFLDSLQQGQEGRLQIALENLSPYHMDSMLVKFKIIDANNVSHDFGEKRFRPLPGNDTLIVDYNFNADAFVGNNTLLIEANPNNDQPEYYHPNNIAYVNMTVKKDMTNPLLDVTFDGVHILDKDIVSAKPFIKIELKDENQYLKLNDSSLITVQLVRPNSSSIETIAIDGTICKFIPAHESDNRKNSAYIEYRPTLEIDGVYKLIVEGKDKTGNKAGNSAKYEVNFTVENKPSITNVLNYPNPFSTSTQFVFTLTGSEVPSQFKIQILSVTGKVVREITRNEIGNLRIGRNITDYRWDGKDQYGQLLGNGVYLYRVVSSIENKNIELRKNTQVDKYFQNGYGKLYIMR